MLFTECKISGAFVIEIERLEDARGFFARAFCREEFEERGLIHKVAQVNIGFSKAKATLRGIHYQMAPHAESKLVRCTRGAVYDVIADLRPGSPSCGQWVGVELTADNHRMLYLPQGVGHGYETLEDNSELLYQTSEAYHRESACGIRYDDPALGIEWPLEPGVISTADLSWPRYSPQRDMLEVQSDHY